jgi:hypothetical protein
MLVKDAAKNNNKPGGDLTTNLFMISRTEKEPLFNFAKEISYERNTFT